MKTRLFPTVLLCAVLNSAPSSGQLGTVTFENSGAPRAQEAFVRGVLLLHSFEYGRAAAEFRQAQESDPTFAMAFWGEAMTYNHPVWFEQDRDAARAALRRLAPTAEGRRTLAPTPREKEYLDAVEVLFGEGAKATRDSAYSRAMGRLAGRYPDDLDARAFYALSLLGTSHGGRHVPTYMRAGALAEEVFRDNPNHPGAVHYLIHSYDDPVHAPLGLRAARAYARIAPAASHAQHMTSHIFVAMGMWDDVVSANEASFEVSGNTNYHALHWLAYGYLQQGRFEDALAEMQRIRERPRPGRAYLRRMWGTHVIAAQPWQRSDGIVSVQMSEDDLSGSVVTLFADGYLALKTGDRERVMRRVTQLAAMLPDAEGELRNEPGVQSVRASLRELQAAIHFEDGDVNSALSLMEEAMAIEDVMPFEFGPPVIVKPTHEMMGEMLLALDRPAEAVDHFKRALELAPQRALSLLGLARAAVGAGRHETAVAAYEQLRDMWSASDDGRPEVEEARRFAASGGH